LGGHTGQDAILAHLQPAVSRSNNPRAQSSVLFEDVGGNTINDMDSKGQGIRAGVDRVSESSDS